MSYQEEIIRLYEIIRPRLLKLGVKLTTIAYKLDNIQSANGSEQSKCAKWLQAFIDVRLGELDRVMALVPDWQWANYEMIGAEDLKEQRLRAKAEKEIIEEWRHRPDILRKISLNKGSKNDKNGNGKGGKRAKKSNQRNAERPK